MKIGIDIDGVLADFVESARRVCKHLWPDRDFSPVPAGWDFPNWPITKAEQSQMWGYIDSHSFYWERIPRLLSEISAFQAFLKNNTNHDIFLITSRKPSQVPGAHTVARQTTNWLVGSNVWPQGNTLQILVVTSPKQKLPLIIALGIEAFIDDYGPTVEAHDSILEHSYLLDRPWNQEAQVKNRVKSLTEFFAALVPEKVKK